MLSFSEVATDNTNLSYIDIPVEYEVTLTCSNHPLNPSLLKIKWHFMP